MSWNEFVDQIERVESQRLEQTLSWVNEMLRESVRSGVPEGRLDSAPMTRLLLYYALSISDQARSKKHRAKRKPTTQYNIPRWTQVSRDINEFSKSQKGFLEKFLCKTYGDDNIAQFATLSSRSHGTSTSYFYSTILLFIIHRHYHGAFSEDFFRRIASREDKLFSDNSINILQDRFQSGTPAVAEENSRPVRTTFFIKDSLFQAFEKFHSKFSIGYEDKLRNRQVNIILYRPRRSNPKELMKTYAAIYRRGNSIVESSSYEYTLIYRPPSAVKQDRFSHGKIIPLDDAVYFLGGQRDLSQRSLPLPFSSIRVMAIKWQDINNFHQVFPLLIMTANYSGKIVVSRAAGRITPLNHSSILQLRNIDIGQIERNLDEDRRREVEFIQNCKSDGVVVPDHVSESFPLLSNDLNIREISKTILFYSNNDPHSESGWSVPNGFVRGNGKDAKAMTTSHLGYLLAETLGEGAKEKILNEEGETFDLWSHTRFGPLALE